MESEDLGKLQIPNPTKLSGFGCSRGIAVGTAMIIDDISFGQPVQSGSILILPDGGACWTVLLEKCSGFICESGGPLSHLATIAREMGIPAVCGLKNASRTITNGTFLRIDGTTGVVEVLGDKTVNA